MRISQIVHVRASPIVYAKHFGNLTKVHGMYRFALAPNEQKAFPNGFKGWLYDSYKGIRKQWLDGWKKWTIPLGIFIISVYWAETTYYKLNRKNPDDYKDGNEPA
uniref:Cytochrome b-c1 complex subunit 8 n=1 Tax=Acrobeloides nanus TaxID=290746 RepID=A0A914CVW5_9BILA